MYVNKTGVLWAWVRAWKLHLAILAVVSASTVVHVAYVSAYVSVSGVVVSVVGTAISFFIGFLNAQAYDRWWEARKIWGEIVNDSRSFARLALTFFPSEEQQPGGVEIQHRLIRRHIERQVEFR